MPSSSGISRRAVLAAAGSLAALPLLSATKTLAGANDDDKHPWIDAHSHIWTTDLKSYPLRNNQTVDVLAPRSFTDEELMAIAEPVGVGRVVLIQHHPYHGFDNSYLIDTWKKHPKRFRIVGQIDDTWPHVDQLMKQMKQTGVTGFRIGPREDRKDWLGGDGMQLMWKTGAETGQSMCCLINPENIPQVSEWCAKYPETPVVIDHFARVGMTGEIRESDVAALCGLSKHSKVRVKISAYYALGKKRPPHDELAPMIRRLFETFGPDRLMWASDSPYQIGAPNTYLDSIRLVQERLDFLSEADRRSILRTTAESTFFFA